MEWVPETPMHTSARPFEGIADLASAGIIARWEGLRFFVTSFRISGAPAHDVQKSEVFLGTFPACSIMIP